MIKCPNCGSTAQVESYPIGGHTTGLGGLSINEDWCGCGCGCHFIYELFENRINKTQKEEYRIVSNE